MNRVILHIDMDAFYASVEQHDDPALRGKPVIVGGTSMRGVVSAANYEARKFGVHSAMPIFQAQKRCPEGIFVGVRMGRYREISKQIMGILRGYSPLIEQVSIDEAYMDISGTDKLLGSPAEIGLRIKQGIRDATGLSCSVGIAPSKFLAKIASEMDKPDGLTIIDPEDVEGFIKNLPIEKVPGVGEKMLRALREMGIHRLGDVQGFSEERLLKKTGKFGKRLLRLSRGIDEAPVVSFAESKSISSEETLPANTNDMEVLKKELLIKAEIVGRRAREKGVKGTTITLKLKGADFTQMTRSVTIHKPTNSSNTIYEQGLRLLLEVRSSSKFRLIGIGLSNLVGEEEVREQLRLFHGADPKGRSWADVEKAMDTIKGKFGRDAIKRGGLLKDPETKP